jgi:hypothetical protein
MWEKFLVLLKQLGVDVTAKKSEIDSFKADVEKIEKDANGNIDFSKLDLSKLSDKDLTPLLKEVIAKSDIVAQQNADLLKVIGEEKQLRENSTKAAIEKAEKDAVKKVDDTIALALKEGRITKADESLWRTRLTKDPDEWGKEILAKSVPKEFQTKQTKINTEGTPKSTGNKTLDAVLEQNQAAAIKDPFQFNTLKAEVTK